MFIIAFYSPSKEIVEELSTFGIIRKGVYGKQRCGGAVDWFIIKEKISAEHILLDALWIFPYSEEKYLYVFSPYNFTDKNTPMINFLMYYQGTIRSCREEVYTILTNTKIKDFNHDKDYFEEYDDPDVYGGTVEFSEL